MDTTGFKEYHLHIFFFSQNRESFDSACNLQEQMQRMITSGYLIEAKPLPGPDLKSSYNTDPVASFGYLCPTERVKRALDFLLRNRGGNSILIHPLTDVLLEDLTTRATWAGPPMQLRLDRPDCSRLV